MSDLHVEVRYGLPEFEFDLPPGWELLQLTADNVDQTVRTVLGDGAPDAVASAAQQTRRAFHEEQTFAIVRFNDPERGYSRTWLSLSALRAPAGKTIGGFAGQLVEDHEGILLDTEGRVLRWTPKGPLTEGMFGRTCYLLPAPGAPEERALYITGWTVVTDGHRPADPEHLELLLHHQATMVLRHRWVDADHIRMSYEAIAEGRIAD